MRWVDHEGSCAAALWGLSHPRIFITHQQKAPPERSERGFLPPLWGRPPTTSLPWERPSFCLPAPVRRRQLPDGEPGQVL